MDTGPYGSPGGGKGWRPARSLGVDSVPGSRGCDVEDLTCRRSSTAGFSRIASAHGDANSAAVYFDRILSWVDMKWNWEFEVAKRP